MLGNITAVLFSLLIAFGGAELVVRFALDTGLQYDIEMWKYARELKRVSEDPNIGHEHQPNSRAYLMGAEVRINEYGFRDDSFLAKKQEAEIRIVLIGDSTTFAWGVAQEKTQAAVMEDLLAERGINSEVLNTGVGNYNSVMQANAFFKHADTIKPDIIVINYFINDAEPIPNYAVSFLDKYSMAWIYFSSRMGVAARTFGMGGNVDWKTYYDGLYNEKTGDGWREAQNALARLFSYGRKNNIPVIFAHLPEVRRLLPYPFAPIRDKLAKFAAYHDIPFLDYLDFVRNEEPSSLWVTVPDPHPNAKAQRLFAIGLIDYLEKQNFFID